MYFSCCWLIISCEKNVIGLYWYGVGVTHKIVREPVINNHSELISRTSLGFSISNYPIWRCSCIRNSSCLYPSFFTWGKAWGVPDGCSWNTAAGSFRESPWKEKVRRKKLWHGNENMYSQERGKFYLPGSLEDHGWNIYRIGRSWYARGRGVLYHRQSQN